MIPTEQDEVYKQVPDILDKGWIKPSNSPYEHPVLFIKKKTGDLYLYMNYRL